MRSPLLIVLVALAYGLISPLCCCQAAFAVAAIEGSGRAARSGQHVAAGADACCDRPADTSPGTGGSPSGPCDQCPSCEDDRTNARPSEGALTPVPVKTTSVVDCPLPRASDALIHVGRRPVMLVPPRGATAPPTSLVRMHCALIV